MLPNYDKVAGFDLLRVEQSFLKLVDGRGHQILHRWQILQRGPPDSQRSHGPGFHLGGGGGGSENRGTLK